MTKKPNRFSLIPLSPLKKMLGLLLLLIALFFNWTLPAQATGNINPQLEEQVLQILHDHPEAILESVQAYQERLEQEQYQLQQASLQEIATHPQRTIGNSPTTGASDLKVVLLEFSDFQCPYCGRAYEILKEFMAKHQDEVTLVYKHYPLISIHPQAMPAAKAAWAATQQGKFWPYYDALFTQQDKLGEELYLDIARDLNLDLEQFNRDREAVETGIEQDMRLAEGLGLSGTPFFAIFAADAPGTPGETFSGALPLSEMEKVLARVSQAS